VKIGVIVRKMMIMETGEGPGPNGTIREPAGEMVHINEVLNMTG
jgi:hypothetical protein